MLGQSRQRERERRVGAAFVVHHEPVETNVVDAHDLGFAEAVHRDAQLLLGTEANRLAVRELDQHLGPRVLVEDRVERAVVEHVAVLVHLDERGAGVLVCTPEDLDHVLAIHVVRPRHEAGFGTQRHRDRIERVVERAERRRLRDLADFTRR